MPNQFHYLNLFGLQKLINKIKTALSDKVDKVEGKGLSTEDYTTAEKEKLSELTNDYTNHTNKPSINSVTLSGNKTSYDLGLLPLSTKYGASISVTIDDSTYVVTAILKDQDGNTLGTPQTIDLPLESMVVDGEYDDTTEKIILTLKNGQTVEFSVADLVAGLQTEITTNNKLSADLVDDNDATNKFMTAAEKTKLSGIETGANKTIVDSALSDNSTNPVQNQVIKSALSDKVDKVTGKGLSTEDYTTVEKTKLAGLSNDYTNHTNKPSINSVALSGNKTSSDLGLQAEITSSNKLGADLVDDTNATNKFITAAEKTKLSGIETGANKTVVDSTFSDTSTNPVQNKVIKSALSGKVDKVTGKSLSTEDYTTAEKTKLSGIESEANKTIVDSALSDTSTNPLQNKVIKTALNGKVDKVTGKGLSTEDYTTAEKSKLEGLTNDYTNHTNKPQINGTTLSGNKTSLDLGLQAEITESNLLSADLVDDTDADNKFMTAAEKTKLSGIATGANKTVVDSALSDTSTNPVQNQVINSALSGKVDKVTGKGLSTEDYTTTEKTKLSGIESEANKTVVDSALSDTSTNPLQNKVIKTALSGKVDKVTGKGLSTNDYTTVEKTKLAGLSNDYTNHTNKPSINSVTLSGNKTSLDLGLLPSSTKYGTSISVTIDDSTYVVTIVLKDQDGNTLGTAQTIDLPLESMVVSGEYDDSTKKIILTLKNEQTVEFSVADLVAGLQTEITSSNKLSADLVDDRDATNKFMTVAEKTKLSGIESEANKTIVDSTLSDTSTNPLQNKAIKSALNGKVDKVTGKGLSTEDYTTTEKTKLAGLTNDYDNHTNKPQINSVTLSGNKTISDLGLQAEITEDNKLSADLVDDTDADNKFVSAAEKTKLSGIETGANKTVVDSTLSDTSTNPVQNKAVKSALSGKVDKVTGKGLSTEDYTTAEKTKLSGIEIGANKTIVDSALSDTSTNPVQNQVINSALSGKVDKVTGKQLSTEDYTTTEKTKLAGLTNDYANHTNKPSINSITLSGNKTSNDLGLQTEITEDNKLSADLVDDTDATNKFMTAAEKTKLSGIESEANKTIVDSALNDTSTNPVQNKVVKSALSSKVDKVTGKGLSTEDYTTAEKTKLAGLTNDYTNHTNKPQINSVTLSGNKTSLDLGLLPSSTKYGTSISVTIDDSTYVVTVILKDQDGNTLGTAQTIDLPLESMVVDGEYDDTTKKIILTLKNGQTVEFSVADLVAGLQPEITADNKLSADLVDDTDATNKFVSAAEKTKLSGIETGANKTIVDSALSDSSTNPVQNKAVKSALSGKVDKVTGKGLSTNDYTTAEKTKLSGIESEANKTVVDSAFSDTSANPVQNKVIKSALSNKVDKVTGKQLSTEDYTTTEKTKLAGLTNDYANHTNKPQINSVTLSGNKTSSDLGLQAEVTEDNKLSADLVDDTDADNKFMTESEKTKLSGIETGANKTVVDSTFSDTSTNPVQNKVVKTALSGKVDKVTGKGLSTEDYTTTEKTKLSGIETGANKTIVDSTLSDTSTNPLQNKAVKSALSGKVDKVTGKGLSTEDYTTTEKNKLSGLTNDYANHTNKPSINSVTLSDDKTSHDLGLQAEITEDNKLSADLVDDTDATNKFMTAAEKTKLSGIATGANKTVVDSALSDTSTNPVQNQVINSALSSKVDKVTGKGLSTEDYTTAEKTKLAGLTNDYANHTNKPSINSVTLSGNKTSLDLGLQAEITEDNKLSADLVDDTDATNKFMTAAEKTKLSGIETGANKTVVDSALSDTSTNPVQNKTVKSALSGKVDKVTGKGLSTEDYTTAEKTKLSGIETGANKTVVDSTLSDTSTNPVQNKVINSALSGKVDKVTGKGLSTEDYTTTEKTKLAGLTNDYTNHTNKPSINSVTLSGNKTSLDLGLLPSSTKYGTSISVTINDSTYVVTVILKDQDGNTLGTAQTIDLPLESMVVDGEYDDTTKKIILTLKNGQTVEFSVADLIAGLQTEITSSNKLSADLVDDTDTTNKFMTAAEKTKLSGIATGANKTVVDSALSGTSTNPVQNKVINSALNGKVDKVTGKGLSTEDYTTTEKTKLSGIESEANKTVVDSTFSDTSTNPVQNKVVKSALSGKVDKVTGKQLSTEDYTTVEKTKLAGLTNDYANHNNKPSINSVTLSGDKTSSDLGLQAEITESNLLSADLVDDTDATNKFMTAAEKTKLSGIETGANKTVVDSTFSDTSTNPVQNKVVKSALSGKVDKVTGKGLSTEDYTTAEKTKLSGIESEANKTIVDSALSDTSTNPVQNKVVKSALSGKVDKVTGKGLSTNDYTTTEKNKLSGLTNDYTNHTNKPQINSVTLSGNKTSSDLGLQAEITESNLLSADLVDDTDATNKFMTAAEKTKLSGIETSANKTIVDSTLSDTSTNPVQNQVINSALSSKVDKVTGKQLSTEDYTTAEKTKLSGIATGANKTTVDSTLSDTSTNPVQNKVVKSALSGKVDKVTGKGLSTEDYTTTEKTKLAGLSNDYTGHTNKPSINSVTLSGNKTSLDLGLLPSSTKYGASISVTIDDSTYVVTAILKDQDGNTLGTAQTIDLPLESMVVDGEYDDTTKKIILTLKNDQTVEFSVADLVAGLQTEITSSNKLSADLVDDTDATNKFMTAAEKTKLSGIATGANKTVVDSTLSDTSTNPLQNKAVKSALNGKVDKVTGKGLSTEDYTTTEKTKLSGIESEANKTVVDSTLSDTSTNPLQNKVIKTALSNKVDKVTGKGLSTEDYTTTEKTKLAGLTNDYANHTNKPQINSVTLSGNKTISDLGLQAEITESNLLSADLVDDTDADNKFMTAAEKTKLSGIATGANKTTVDSTLSDSSTNPVQNKVIKTALSSKVDKVTGKGLSTNDYTTTEKNKLSGIESEANKTIVDSTLSDTSTNPVQNQVINSALSGKVDKVTGKGLSTNDYTTTEKTKLAGLSNDYTGHTNKPSINSVTLSGNKTSSDLGLQTEITSSNKLSADLVDDTDATNKFVSTAEKTKLSGIETGANKTIVDSTLSDTSTNPVQNQVINSALSGKVDKVTGKGLSAENYTREEKTKLSGIETGANKTIVDTALSDTSTNPVRNYVIKIALSSKVDKVTGKGLSTEDYTSEEKTKLSGIETGANKTIVDSTLSDTSTNPVQNKVIKENLDDKYPKAWDVELTQAQYNALPASKYVDDKCYWIPDGDEEYPIIYGFHVDPDESDPSDAVTYLMDAVGMEPASMGTTTFNYGSWKNAFFIPRPCMLKYDGTVDYYLDPNDFSKKVDGTASDINNYAYNGNAMMEFPKIWFKFVAGVAEGEGYFYVSNQQVDSSYHCWANYDSDGNQIAHFYMSIYNSVIYDGKMRSLSGKKLSSWNITTYSNSATYAVNSVVNYDGKMWKCITAVETAEEFVPEKWEQFGFNGKTVGSNEVNAAIANDTTEKSEWYIDTWCDEVLITALLYLMGKSLDLQSTYGRGIDSGSQTAAENYITGAANDKGLFYGITANGDNVVKVFGIENFWGLKFKRVAGCIGLNDGKVAYKMTSSTADGSTATTYNTTGDGYLVDNVVRPSAGYVSKMDFGAWGLMPRSVNGGNSGLYYCDYFRTTNDTTTFLIMGGHSGLGSNCGFVVHLNHPFTDRDWFMGANLSCKPIANKEV